MSQDETVQKLQQENAVLKGELQELRCVDMQQQDWECPLRQAKKSEGL